MNPAELRMLWMSQYGAERMILDDTTSFYGPQSVGLSVMDDITHQTSAMDMNPMMGIVGGEYSGQVTPGFTSGPQQQQQPATLITTVPQNDIYGIAQHVAGGIHPVLQHSHGFQVFHDDDDGLDPDGNTDQYIQTPYEQIDDSSCYDTISDHHHHDTNSNPLHDDSKEIINIDDFVMMNDSNSYQDDDDGGNIMEDDNNSIVIDEKPILLNASGNFKKARKIEPISRPGLVLKTPIAYKGNIDPSVIPIQRDGMAVCERCGAIGVKHTFYTKSRRFCSMACARGELYTLVCNDNNKISSSSSTTSSTSSIGGGGGGGIGNIGNASVGGRGPTGSIGGNDGNVGDTIFNNNTNSNNSPNGNTLNESKRTDIELELRVSHIRNSNYRFKMMTNDSPLNNDDCGKISKTNENDIKTLKQQQQTKSILYKDLLPLDEIPQIPKLDRLPSPCPQDDKIISVRRKQYDHLNSFDWTPELSKPDFYAAPVTCFPHAPGYDMWDNIGIDMKVEVENTDCDNQTNISPGQTPHSFWVATILNICGYKALMRYEGFDDSSHDFWVNLCSSEVHSVGWCATRGKPLIPPRSIENKYTDWKDFLVERLSGARTLPSNFYNKISESFKSKFRCGLNLEIVDKNRISQVKLATVYRIVGKRLYLKYYDAPDDGFWCHEDSPIIHPVGWATTVGHNLAAPQDYLDRMLAGREQMIEVHEDDATIELFKMNFTFEEYYLEGKTNGFIEGMKLEAVDPLNLSSICVATVMAVLKFGYMMIRIDSYDPDANGADWFCYHEKSPSIFPVGFCAGNNITLTPPNGYSVSTFRWDKYLEEKNSLAAGEHLFHHSIPNHGFKPGMKLECADLMDPRLVCVATISRVVGRLVKVRFDGWPDEYDQWLDCESPDFYPVGWCILVSHKLEGPPVVLKQQQPIKQAPKTNRKKRKKKIKIENIAATKSITKSINIKKESHENIHNKLNNLNNERVNIKLEMKSEPHDDDNDDDDDDDDFEDDISRSDQSTPLPPTPEPGDKSNKLNLTVNTLGSGSNSNNSNSSNNVQKTTSTSPAPPPERKATSYIGNSSVTSSKYIPRLTDINNSPESSTTSFLLTSSTSSSHIIGGCELSPDTWNIHDVSQFLRVNDCTAHCDTFSRNKIDGKRLLQLTKDDIITLLGMKVGPAIKIFDLIQQLKCKLYPSRSRLMKANINKKFL